MSLFSTVALWGRILGNRRRQSARPAGGNQRILRFEEMESRRLMTAVPQIHLGSVFYNPAPGTDTSANTIQITFQGGAPATQLTQLVINGTKSPAGPAAGDIVWNTANAPLSIVSSAGFQVLSETVANGGSQITLDFSGFVSGDKLVLTVGTDEVLSVNSETGALTTGPMASGNDFQDSHLVGTFTAPHFEPITVDTSYVAGFDALFAQNNATSGTTLDLPTQNYMPPATTDQSDQTAGASVLVTQTPLPISLSGTVYDDANMNNVQDSGEPGVAGVSLTLMEFNGSQFVSAGKTTTTNAAGNYQFQFLQPGTYEVDETVPSGYFAIGASAGTVAGVTDGTVESTTVLTQIALLGGDTSVANDFALVRPASVAGNVSDCLAGTPLSGVTVNLLNASGQVTQTTTTDTSGNYSFTSLMPGATYGVQEVVPTGYLFHEEAAGSVGGLTTTNTQITAIPLGDGTTATAYNFCDVLPATIGGSVADCLAGTPLSGVTVNLLNASGQVIQSTATNAQGNYQFAGLLPQTTYGVQEVVPTGYIFHEEAAGTVGGSTATNTQITQITPGDGVSATGYNFCDVLPASISGGVADCLAGTPLSGVTVNLLNSSGQIVQSTTTNSSGDYQFTGLLPGGTYGVQEIVPAGYLFHDEAAGSVGGSTGTNTQITQVSLTDGAAATGYNFCDVLPASIAGNVGDCEANTELPSVTVNLLNSSGTVIQSTTTDDNGNYSFTGLMPGLTYAVQEIVPTGYLFHEEWAGSAGGSTATNGQITQVALGDGVAATAYNFCDVLPVGISGSVLVDTTGNFQPTEPGLAGVTVNLLDSGSNIINTAVTDSNGAYSFLNLMPGTYGVETVTPANYFAADAAPGSEGGTAVGLIEISQVTLTSGEVGTQYDFYVQPPATISGYVFQDGAPIQIQPGQSITPDQIAQLRTGVYQPGDTPISGVTMELADANGNPITDSNGLPITTVTDANGFYQFTGLPHGQYSVIEAPASVQFLTQQSYILGLDTPGTTGGLALNINANQMVNSQTLAGLTIPGSSDAIIAIPVPIGAQSANNNFSVVQTELTPIPPPPPSPPPTPVPLPPPFSPPQIAPSVTFNPPVAPPSMVLPVFPSISVSQLTAGGSGEELPYAWHLSVLDDGQPRESEPPTQQVSPDQGPLVYNSDSWESLNMGQSRWTVNAGEGNPDLKNVFGAPGAVPVYGDFLGDGRTLMGVFLNGEWFIDTNGNGVWDEGDLYCKLGGPGDTPVVGDWDGDGKDDIGVFGPGWYRDEKALAREPGLPKPGNLPSGVMKNMPPKTADATFGGRTVQRTKHGKLRADVVDHVFQFGHLGDIPVVGDWTGSGVRTLGIFRDGVWYLDVNGTGKWAASDIEAHFGQHGDIPVVGDWDGSGVDSIGVFRNGTWYLDAHHGFKMDGDVEVRKFGDAGDKPVVGDFNGSGHTQIGVYHEGQLEKAVDTTASAVDVAAPAKK